MSIDRRDLLLGGTAVPLLLGRALAAPPLRRHQGPDILAHARKVAGEFDGPLRLLIPQGSGTNVAPIVAAFSKGTGVHVEIEETPVDDVATTMTVRTLAGDPGFDVGLPPTFAIPDLAEAGIITPLDEMTAMDVASSLEPSLYALGDRYRDRTYGVQTDGDVYLMFFNRGMLEDEAERAAYRERFGVPLTVPSTWEELDRQMEFFHRPDEGRFGGTLFRTPPYMAWEYWIRLHAKGVFPFDDGMHPRLTEKEGLDAARELVRATSSQGPGVASDGLFENWAAYKAGRSYANIGWGGSMKSFRAENSPIRDNIVVAETPGGTGANGAPFPVSYFNWGWNYTVSARSSVAELGAAFALFATEPKISTDAVAAADGFFDPFRESHFEDSRVRAIYTPSFLDVHHSAMSRAIPDLYLEGRVEYFDLLGRFLDRANRGKSSVEDAMALIEKGWERITDRIGRKDQVSQWRNLRSSYPDEVSRHLR